MTIRYSKPRPPTWRTFAATMEIKSCYTDLKVTASGKKLDELLETAAKCEYYFLLLL